MTTFVENVREVANFVTHEPRSSVAVKLRSTSQLNDYVHSSTGRVLRETAHVVSAITGYVYSVLRDTAQVSSSASGSVKHTRVVREVAELNSRETHGVVLTQVLRESARVLSSADGSVDIRLRETARVLSEAMPSVGVTEVVRETARLKSYGSRYNGITARETARVVSNATVRQHFSYVERESAHLADAPSAFLRNSQLIRERGELRSAASARVHYNLVVRERGYLYSRVEPSPSGRAYTAQVVTWGMSVYRNYPFVSEAGDVLAASDQRVYRRTGVSNNGVVFEGSITTGQVDYGNLTRPSTMLIGGHSEGNVSVSVMTMENDKPTAYTYETEEPLRDGRRTTRAKLGKGLRGRYHQYKIGSESAFTILDAKIDVAQSARRV